MPTYQYECKNCGFALEELQTMSEPPLVHCPHCGKDALARIIGSGTGLIFKGSGFYLTDYKKKSSSPGSADKKEPKEPKGGTEGKGKKGEAPSEKPPSGKDA